MEIKTYGIWKCPKCGRENPLSNPLECEWCKAEKKVVITKLPTVDDLTIEQCVKPVDVITTVCIGELPMDDGIKDMTDAELVEAARQRIFTMFPLSLEYETDAREVWPKRFGALCSELSHAMKDGRDGCLGSLPDGGKE